MVGLAVAAGRAGGTAPAAYNAANEQAVAAFLDDRVRVLDIPRVVAAVLEAHANTPVADLADVVGAEAEARAHAGRALAARQKVT